VAGDSATDHFAGVQLVLDVISARIADGVTVRQFAEFCSDPMVKHNAATALQSLSRTRQNKSVII
jgi:hypothetical protein